MRISDWSSDVCSSDLAQHPAHSILGDRKEVAFTDGRVHVERDPEQEIVQPHGRLEISVLPPAIEECQPHLTHGIKQGLIRTRYAGKKFTPGVTGDDACIGVIPDRKSTRLNSSPSCAARMP